LGWRGVRDAVHRQAPAAKSAAVATDTAEIRAVLDIDTNCT
jgi:hypothetical protein